MRYGTNPQQQFVNMYTPLDTSFYANILGQAQSNLNQGEAMKAKILEDAYGMKHFDEATHKAQVAQVEQDIAGLTEANFISPSNIIKGISKAGQKFAPYKNLVGKQLEEAKREQELRDRWGSNYIGNTVNNLNLTDPSTGQLISPDKVKLTAGNREDLQQALTRDFGNLKEAINSQESGLYPIMGGKFYQNTTTTTRGLTPERWEKEFKDNPQLVQQYMQQMPELSKAIQASGQTPEQYLANEISNISKQWIGGAQQSNTQVSNPDWGRAAESSSMKNNRFVQELNKEEADKNTTNEFTAVKEALKNPQAAAEKANSSLIKRGLQTFNVDHLWNGIVDSFDWATKPLGIEGTADKVKLDIKDITPEKVYQEATKKLKELKVNYTPLYKDMKESGIYGNEKSGYNYGKLHEDFIDNAGILESYVRQTKSTKLIISPDEAPKIYNDLLNRANSGDVLMDINSDGTVSTKGKSYSDLVAKGKLTPNWQEASMTLNPHSGQIELTDVTGEKKYAIDRNRLDVDVKTALENVEKASKLKIQHIKNGYYMSLSPEEKIAYEEDFNEIANYADDIFKFKYGKNTK